MQFNFDEVRAVQAAHVLLKLSGGRETGSKLLKLLYLADRESLVTTGTPIAGASFFQTENGPVSKEIYNCIMRERPDSAWSGFFQAEGDDVVLRGNIPGDGELSDHDVLLLEGIHSSYGGYKESELVEVLRGLPEWLGPQGSLAPEDILRSAGMDEGTLATLEDRNNHVALVEQLLNQVGH